MLKGQADSLLVPFSYSQGKSAELGKSLATRTFVLPQEPVHRCDKVPGSRQRYSSAAWESVQHVSSLFAAYLQLEYI